MDRRSGRKSSRGLGRRAESKKRFSATRKAPSVSDNTIMYKYDEDEFNLASTRRVQMDNSRGSKNKIKSKKTKKKGNTSKALQIIKKIVIAILILSILAFLILAGIIAGIFFGFFGDDFKMTKADLTIEFSNSEVYDANDKLLYTLNGTEQRKIVSLEQMPKYLPKAYVAIEDERFYDHNGVDIKRTGAATVTYLFNRGSSSFGGSTITQQLVKNITKDDDKSALRKVKEMARAIQVEKEISKDDILELYLNIIFVGGKGNLHGVALAAEYYFDKDVSTLDIAESAFLAGINHSPSSYDPFAENKEKRNEHLKLCHDRTKVVLGKMIELGFITQDEYDKAVKKVDKGLPFSKGSLSAGVIYTDHTEAALNQIIEQLMEEKGMTREMAETKVYGGGYKIYTTQDSSLQKIAEKEMKQKKYIKSGRAKEKGKKINDHTQSAIVIIDHKEGKVVACVGRLGEKESNGVLNRATQSKRQVGSAMKPLAVITPAVQEGIIAPGSVYSDTATREFSNNGKIWPENYYHSFRGKMTVRKAIEISGNVIPVRILNEVGLDKAIEYLGRMGMDVGNSDVGLSLALGGKEFSPLQIAAGYATIANDGLYIEPTFYRKVVDSSGNIVIEPNQKKDQILGKSEDYLVKSIVTQPVVGGSGTATFCRMSGFDVAAKTGSTDDYYDRWLCEFTTYYTAACWYGYDIREKIVYSGSPSNPAGAICSAIMKSIHKDLEPTKFEKPDDIVKATVCRDTGLLPSSGCPTVTDIFIESKLPTERCKTKSSAKSYLICNESGLLAISGVCPKTTRTVFGDGEKPPSELCNIHKATETTPSPTPSPTPSSSPTTSTSANENSTTPTPPVSESPSVSKEPTNSKPPVSATPTPTPSTSTGSDKPSVSTSPKPPTQPETNTTN